MLNTMMVVAGGIYFVFRSAWSFNPYLDMMLKGSLAFVYLPLLYVLGFFTDKEKAKIKAGLSKVGAVLKYH